MPPIATVPTAGRQTDLEPEAAVDQPSPALPTQPAAPPAGSPPSDDVGVVAAQPAESEAAGPPAPAGEIETSPPAARRRPAAGRGTPQPPPERPQPPATSEPDSAPPTLTRAEHEAEVERRVQKAQRSLEDKWDRRVQELVDRRVAQVVREHTPDLVDQRLGEHDSAQREARLWQAVQDNDYLTLAEAKKAELEQQRTARAAPQKEAPAAAPATSNGRAAAAPDLGNLVLQVWSQQVDPLLHGLLERVDDDARQAIGSKDYGEDPVEARASYLQDVLDSHAKRAAREAVQKARARWEKDELPAAVERRLQELEVEEPAPDLEGGGPVTDELTPERYTAMTFEDRRALRKTQPDAYERMLRKAMGQT